ncbi:hypothetical protein TRL7639_00307 [Falsiruegeria litorea R37]|uniref:Uncharacterized protein n=1 Tax=Falsiruegeria litorea R37 TaxID=1200284 RepID=A0A1Y5RFG5_9RHOB|nr:hypothetical protein [Falsiruegeria litorea]SLN16309.1 hypothetical protein TRL7639_00307 [Falsiruegeria litorea R37]
MLRLFFKLPFWVYLLLAVGVGYLTEQAVVQGKEREADRAQALRQAPPDVVDLSAYDPANNRALADEVVVSGWINREHNTVLTKSKSGITTGMRYMYVMAGRDDPEGSRIARAGIILTEAEREAFLDASGQFLSGLLPQGFELTLNGQAMSSMSFSDVALKAMKEQGVAPAKNFFFLNPFLHGRDVALALDPSAEKRARTIGYGIAGLLVLLALGKFVTRRRAVLAPKGDFTRGPVVSSDGAERALAVARPHSGPHVCLEAAPLPKRATRVWIGGLLAVAAIAGLVILPSPYGTLVAVGVLVWRILPQNGHETSWLGAVQNPLGGMTSHWPGGRSKAVARKMASDPFARLRQVDHGQV